MGEEFYGGICSTANWCNTSLLNDHSMNWTESFSQAAEMHNLIETGYGDEMNEAHNGLLPILFEPVESLNNYTMNDSFKPCTEVTNEPDFLSINTTKRFREVKCDRTECNETKKARISLLSHLPTFKVRKEKLGDRVTALQQLVSPFGKTDTASVLQEAVDHIKFLHSQIGALSKAFFRNSHDMVQESMEISRDAGVKKEPKSDGLCLVPVSLTFVLAREEPAMDIWAAALCGSRYI